MISLAVLLLTAVPQTPQTVQTSSTATAAMTFTIPDPNPFRWNDEQVILASTIIGHAEENDLDPYLLLSIAWVESRINPKSRSNTGDYGMFQVNCKRWWRQLEYDSLAHCHHLMLDPLENLKVAVMIVTQFSSEPTCYGNRISNCYNGGPGWKLSKNREKIEEYSFQVRNVLHRLKRYYTVWIEQCRQYQRDS